MSSRYRWIHKSGQAVAMLGLVCGFGPSANAEFFPDKGIMVMHWDTPSKQSGFEEYYWLDDHQIVYPQYYRPDGTPLEQYIQRDLTTGQDHVLEGLTAAVQKTIGSWSLPALVPSPDGKYVAWIGTGMSYSDTLVVATRDGSIVSQQSYKTRVCYPGWSDDSQWCFGFLEGRVPYTNPAQGSPRRGYATISAISIKTPSVAKSYPIAIAPDGPQSTLTGYITRYHRILRDPALPDFHFGSDNILMVSSADTPSANAHFEEFQLADNRAPTETHTVHMPASWRFDYAVFSPRGDSIAWRLRHGDDLEIWLSDRNGGSLKRIGKFYKGEAVGPDNIVTNPLDPLTIQWLPGGNAIGFKEAGKLYMVQVK